MLSRSSKIIHPNGEEIYTPILVPSYSSKGLRYKSTKSGNLVSEITFILKSTYEYLTDIVLISAYDIEKDFIPYPLKSIHYNPQITIIDSGGYETSEGYDFSEVLKYPITAKKGDWSLDKYKEVLSKWPRRFPAIMVSYDHGQEKGQPLIRQINNAKRLFNEFPNFLHNFLIKSSHKNEILSIDELLDHITLLRGFHIIGITEKELGTSISDRLKKIVTLRRALDRVEITAPLHIFGSLDPITSVLYFLAGAEIFDGLTWLRYGFQNGFATYQQNHGIIKYGLNESDNLIRDLTSAENLIYLRRLQSEMLQFTRSKNISVFSYNVDLYKKTLEFIKTI